MILCKTCQEEGLIHWLVSQGERDCKFVVDGTELYGIKSILRSSNYKMREIIDNATDKNNIVLSSPVTAYGLYELMRYYGHGKLNLQENTVVTIYLTVQYFHDVDLETILTEFIINHLTSNLIISTHILKCFSYFIDLNIQAKLNQVLTFNGYKYFSDSYINKDYDPIILGYVLQIPMLIIDSEDYIVQQLLKYYNCYIQNSNDSNSILLFQQILSYVKGKQLSSIGIMDLSQYQLIEYVDSSSNGLPRVYFKPTGNEILDETLSELCCSNASAFHLSENMKEKLIKIIDLEILLSALISEENKNDKIFFLALIIIIELDYPYKLNEKEQFLCTTRLINVYNNLNQHLDICNKMIFECATLICFYQNTFGLIKVHFKSEDLMGILSNYFLMEKNNLQIFLEMLYSLNMPSNVWNSLKMILNMNNMEDKKFYNSIMLRVYPHHSQQMNASSQRMYMQQQEQQPPPMFIPPQFNPQLKQSINPTLQQQQPVIFVPPPLQQQQQQISQDNHQQQQQQPQQQPIFVPPPLQQQQQQQQQISQDNHHQQQQQPQQQPIFVSQPPLQQQQQQQISQDNQHQQPIYSPPPPPPPPQLQPISQDNQQQQQQQQMYAPPQDNQQQQMNQIPPQFYPQFQQQQPMYYPPQQDQSQFSPQLQQLVNQQQQMNQIPSQFKPPFA